MTRSQVHQLVNAWQQIAILWASFVRISEVNAHPLLAINFLDHHHMNVSIVQKSKKLLKLIKNYNQESCFPTLNLLL